MSDDALSKRARQKQRRDAKLAEQRQQQARARRNRLVMFSIVALLVIGLIGLGVYRYLENRRASAEQVALVQQQLEDLGCTGWSTENDKPLTSLGGGHLESSEQLTASPPETLYADRPTASGQHHPSVVKSGFYDVQVDERLLVHNLEHGYVNVWYDEGLPDDQLADLKTFVTESVDGAYPKMIAVPFDGDLPEDKNVAFTAWTYKQTCSDFDSDVLDVFAKNHHSGAGVAPEKTVSPHLTAGSGVLDPEGEDLLLPPLGAAQPTEGVSEHGGSEEAPAPTEDAS